MSAFRTNVALAAAACQTIPAEAVTVTATGVHVFAGNSFTAERWRSWGDVTGVRVTVSTPADEQVA